jgi:hypothetical protein
VKQEK